MTDDISRQLQASLTPGALLKAAREARGLPEKEVAEQLNLMPGYVSILERDDYQELRSPAFARGYVKAYGRLLGLDEELLLGAFDRLRASRQVEAEPRADTRPPQLQRTGVGVVVSLVFLLVLVLALRWWHGAGSAGAPPDAVQPGESPYGQVRSGQTGPGEKSPGMESPGVESPGVESPGKSTPGRSTPGQAAAGADNPAGEL